MAIRCALSGYYADNKQLSSQFIQFYRNSLYS